MEAGTHHWRRCCLSWPRFAIRTADWLLLFNSSNISSTTTRAIDSATITLGRSMSPLTDVCGTPAMFVHRAAPRTECKQGPRAHTALTPGYRYPSTSATTHGSGCSIYRIGTTRPPHPLLLPSADPPSRFSERRALPETLSTDNRTGCQSDAQFSLEPHMAK